MGLFGLHTRTREIIPEYQEDEGKLPPSGHDIHTWFGLTYASYLVLNRSLLQSMPEDWQVQFVALLEVLQDAFCHLDFPDRYQVSLRGPDGKFIRETIPHYNRGRTHIPTRWEVSGNK